MPDRIGTEQFGRVPRLIACGVRNRNQNAAPSKGTFMATPGPARPKVSDWTKPTAMAIIGPKPATNLFPNRCS